MEPFTTHTGKLALLDRANVDTDQIIPKHHLKSIKRTGFEKALFDDWRFKDGQSNKDFELNQARFQGATILVTRNNFGCGSSREHAVWALYQYGFRVIIAPRKETDGNIIPAFADIFRNNCVKNGLLTLELDEATVQKIFDDVNAQADATLEATVDVPHQTLTLLEPGKEPQQDRVIPFTIDPGVKERFTQGLDDIGMTLKYLDTIVHFEKKHFPQLYK